MLRRMVDCVVGVVFAAGVVTLLVWLVEPSRPVAASPVPVPGAEQDALMVRLGSDDAEVQIEALIEAGGVPEPGEDLVDKVLELGLSRDQYVRLAAQRAMAHMGEALHQRLGRWLEHPEPARFMGGCIGVQALGRDGGRWEPQVAAGLTSEFHACRMAALFALEAIGPAAEPALEQVIRMLRDPEFNIQQAACRVITSLGPTAARAAPELVWLIDNGVVSARTRALVALAAIGPVEGIDTVGIIRKWVDAFTVTDRERSLEALALIGPGAAAAKEDVRRLMEDPGRSVVPHAAYTWYRITGERDRAVGNLIKLLDNYDTRTAAMEKLGLIGTEAADAVEPLAGYLTYDEAPTREAALFALGAIGGASLQVADRIESMSRNDPDLLLRAQARDLLERLRAQTAGDGGGP